MTDFETTTCYHCDAEGTGREHVPPKCLFPKGGDWSRLMTVPSCVTHNNANSKADEYLKFGGFKCEAQHPLVIEQ
ncbi:hypothetical protein, partial [Cupriavidus metallidurans]|uniref:hypothetical protein n=1 Tax=Cupriavidus metallidurans TaxID=119219 RepID=UPI000A94804A